MERKMTVSLFVLPFLLTFGFFGFVVCQTPNRPIIFTTVVISNSLSGNCLTNIQNRTVRMEPCSGRDDQKWDLGPDYDTNITTRHFISARHTRLCLELGSIGKASRSLLSLTGCNGPDNFGQEWDSIPPIREGSRVTEGVHRVKIMNKLSGTCLGAKGQGSQGGLVAMVECLGDQDQVYKPHGHPNNGKQTWEIQTTVG